jgi:hypothetical protein
VKKLFFWLVQVLFWRHGQKKKGKSYGQRTEHGSKGVEIVLWPAGPL